MIDTHCHMDLYPDPARIAREALAAKVGTIVVTNLPSAYNRAFPYIGNVKGIKLALGLHPLVALKHGAEMSEFARLCQTTAYIGEVGLDFSPEGYKTKDIQEQSFRFVLQAVRGQGKFITIHSRRAEAEVLRMLSEEEVGPVVFHWYSGPLKTLDSVLSAGHYFSINPAMLHSQSGMRIINRLPSDRVLTETDGPFVTVQGRPAVPSDVALVEDYLADTWSIDKAQVSRMLKVNFSTLRNALGGLT